VEAMLPYFTGEMGNAQSVHSFGQRARAAVEHARRQVAALINAAPGEIVFVSGGTESDNLALRGIAEGHRDHPRHIITTQIEHPAVLATAEALEAQGHRVTYLPVSNRGLIDLDGLRAALSPETVLVSVMQANNETGTVQPISDVAKTIAEARTSSNEGIYLHTDAVQSAGKLPIDVKALGVDLLSISAHKLHGPKGVGALYVKKGTRLGKILYGGHHERDRRPGTENVPGIVGFGMAAKLARLQLNPRRARMRELRDYLEEQVAARIPGVRINGDLESRVPNISNMSFEGVDGESLLIALDLKGVAVSTGSACASGSLEPSHVLTALGLSRQAVRGSLRFSLSPYSTREEIEYAIASLEETVTRLLEMSPDEDLAPSARQ
ncbi:MAG TPA: cysteine desulfurase family protein, partial [Blastocatellia bacterium]|nr:cysteine desulfurase family protein [Blastocatellia bacterium]